MKGRKRFLLCDTRGWLLQVGVLPADVQERQGAMTMLRPQAGVQVVWVDAGYNGPKFAGWVRENLGWRVEVVSRNVLLNRREGRDEGRPLPPRWVIERSFAWLGNWRRLACDYEFNPKSSETWITIAFLGLMLARLHPTF